MKNVKDQVYSALLTVTENVSDTYPKDWANFPTIQYVEENNSVWERTDNAEQKAMNGYRIARLGGHWNSGVNAGPFCWALYDGVGSRYRNVGGRLVYIPTKDSDVYLAAIASWKAQMAAA